MGHSVLPSKFDIIKLSARPILVFLVTVIVLSTEDSAVFDHSYRRFWLCVKFCIINKTKSHVQMNSYWLLLLLLLLLSNGKRHCRRCCCQSTPEQFSDSSVRRCEDTHSKKNRHPQHPTQGASF